MKESETLKKVTYVYDLLKNEEACINQARVAGALKEKMENNNLTVSIIGQFKRGKSTLGNAILGDKVLPVGIVPITSAVTKILYGDRRAEVRFNNGVIEPIEFERLSEFISEQENQNNKLGVSSVVLHSPSKFLKNGLEFVDTPGVGSFHKNNTEVAYQYMKESDAVIFLLSVDSPINEIEIEFLRRTKNFAAKFYFAVNKIDIVDAEDLKAYMDYCRQLLCQLMGTDTVNMFPVSAKTGEGIKELEKAVLTDRKKATDEILEGSAALKLRDIIDSAINQLGFYRKAMSMEYAELDKRFEAIEELAAGMKEEAEGCSGGFEIKLNEIKLKVAEEVQKLFEMEYLYEIEETTAFGMSMTKEEFLQKAAQVFDDLKASLNSILLYREENAYIVIRRIANTNLLAKRLREVKRSLPGLSE